MKFIKKDSRVVGVCLALIAVVVLLLPALSQTPAQPETHGIAVAHMDVTVKPGVDFYAYTNGGWLKRTEIPPDRAAVGVFSILDNISSQRTADLIEQAAKSAAPAGSDVRKIADLYNSYMD